MRIPLNLFLFGFCLIVPATTPVDSFLIKATTNKETKTSFTKTTNTRTFQLPSRLEQKTRISKPLYFIPSQSSWYQSISSMLSRLKMNSKIDVDNNNNSNKNIIEMDYVVCGGGPAGLLSAIMMAQKFPDKKIQLYDRLIEPPSPTDETVWNDIDKYYLIGLGGRGITSLETFGVWDDVEKITVPVPGRKDWTPEQQQQQQQIEKNEDKNDNNNSEDDINFYYNNGVEKMLTDRKYMTHVLPRDKLASAIHKHIIDYYSNQIELHYGYDIIPIDLGGGSSSGGDGDGDNSIAKTENVLVDIIPNQNNNNNNNRQRQRVLINGLLIAADGSARTIANQMEQEDIIHNITKPFSITRYDDDNERVYKNVGFKLPNGWKNNLNYGVRSKGGRLTFDALPANNNSDYVGIFLLPKNDDMAKENVNPNEFRSFLNDCLPQFSPLLNDTIVETISKKRPLKLPGFRFVGPRLHHHNKRTVLLGDCAHTVKPYFGMGANSALEDVKVLGQCIDESSNDLSKAVVTYSNKRAQDISTLVQTSYSLDRPGIKGAFTFLIPVIMDAIFHKLAPNIFKPNIINMIQNEEYTFQGAVKRKNIDRIGQLTIIGTISISFIMIIKIIMKILVKYFLFLF